jgi:glutaredoxin 3|tara:strand:- start:811 stop:1071 length:261 start_codon:yes stop_codon:yes gene_type:complete
MKELWNDYMKNTVVIYSTPSCTYCTMAKNLATDKGCAVEYKVFGEDFDREEMMKEFPTARTFPQIMFNGEKIGGYSSLVELLTDEK